MRLSLQRRIQLSFLLSIALVASIGAISFYYLHQLNEQVQQIVDHDIALSHSGEKIKTALFSMRRTERTFLLNPEAPDFHKSMQQSLSEFRAAVEEGLKLCVRDETKKIHEDILMWTNEYKNTVVETSIPFNPRLLAQALDAKTRKIGQAVSEIAELRYADLEAHRKQAQSLSDSSSRNMILMIITTILAGLAVGFFAPSKVVVPFRKLVAAIQEVQGANFNVSVHMGGEDEIAELGNEFNKMVEDIRVFDDMKIKKIAFEKRKLDALANMIHSGVIVISVEGEILYMNRTLYEILGLTSERVLHVALKESPLPKELKELFRESIDRKDRFEERKWNFTYKDKNDIQVRQSVQVSFSPIRNHVGDIVNFVILMKENAESTELAAAPTSTGDASDIGDTW